MHDVSLCNICASAASLALTRDCLLGRWPVAHIVPEQGSILYNRAADSKIVQQKGVRCGVRHVGQINEVDGPCHDTSAIVNAWLAESSRTIRVGNVRRASVANDVDAARLRAAHLVPVGRPGISEPEPVSDAGKTGPLRRGKGVGVGGVGVCCLDQSCCDHA